MKYFSYVNTAAEIIRLYKEQQPFHLFIKDFFRQYKKYGSADRKQITHLCYCYFRLGRSIKNTDAGEKILTALFLCSAQNNEVLAHIKPAWNEKINLPVKEKCAFINIPYETLNIFPFPDELSAAINKNDFILSHFTQPDLFLRTRPGYHQTVLHKLEEEHIVFTSPYENCIGLPNATKIDGLVDINKEAVIQDYSSQRTGSFLQLVKHTGTAIKIWDCCAASGGKSIMAKDILVNIDLTVSDIRESIIINLKKRFAEAGIRNYTSLVTDLSSPGTSLTPETFQLIIADAPCTGSGTWGRTPERLSFFDEKEIDKYSRLQKKIVTAVMPYIKTGGYFLYITCSVFKKENEEIVNFIQEKFGVELVKMEVLKGYDMKADTMFAALLKKST
jgi:16S rRNA (cytosine967-C5)-methyltransferase